MEKILERLRRARVVVVGDVVVDRYVFGTTSRISREAPVPVVRHEREEHRPGGAANAAVNVSALGARAVLMGVVGRDAAARAFKASMKGSGVTLELVADRERRTAEKVRVLAGAQGTRHQQVLRLDMDPEGAPPAHVVEQLARRLEDAVSAGTAVLLSDYGGGLVTGELLRHAVSLGRRVPVVVDSRYALSSVRGPVILKPNAPELAELVGATLRTTQDVVDAARAAQRRAGAVAVVATRGREGMVVVEKGRAPVVLAAHGSGEVTDVTGAGDTVAAALAAALAAGVALVEAARLANIAASIVVQKLGAATASPAEIRAAAAEVA